jgi:O-antigen/teichoic acid export membrane protein
VTRSRLASHVKNTLRRPATWLLGGRGVQLANSVLLSAVVVRHFGLGMVGTYAIGYIAVAFIPHILSLGLNSELPRTRRPMPELLFIAAVIQFATFALLMPLLYLYSRFLARSHVELPIIFVVAVSGCFTGMFNVGLTLNILLRRFRIAFVAPLFESFTILVGSFFAHSGLQLAFFILVGRMLTAGLTWPRLRMSPVHRREMMPVARQGTKYLFLDLLVTFSEQLLPLMLGISAPRAQLGLYRLCQQTASAAETPGWSYVQGKYPEMTIGDPEVNKQIARQARRAGMAAALLCLVGAIPLAFLVFHEPVVALMLAVLSGALTSRYIIYVNDQRLRAEGRIGASLALVISRIVVFAAVLGMTVERFGVWAGIWTSALGAIIFGFLYQHVGEKIETKLPRNLSAANRLPPAAS